MKTYELEKGMLPADAQRALKIAAMTQITPNNPLARIIAIETAIALIQAKRPELFNRP